MADHVEIRVMRDDRRPSSSPGVWQACANASYHRWVPGSSANYCANCGLIDAGGGASRPRRKARPAQPAQFVVYRSENWERRVRYLWDRDGPGCFYCGRDLDLHDARIDHFVPSVRGGPNGLKNRRVACAGCDGLKGGRLPWEVWPGRFSAPLA